MTCVRTRPSILIITHFIFYVKTGKENYKKLCPLGKHSSLSEGAKPPYFTKDG